MALRFIRRRRRPDGRVEVFRPKMMSGYYVLADRAVDPQHNRAVNQFLVRDPVAVAARLRRGGVSMRMVGEGAAPSLISASKIEIIEEAERIDPDGDPFLAFTEWSEPEDEEAWRDL